MFKLKVILPQLINMFPVNLAAINILVLLAIGQAFYTLWDLHKADISCNIVYKTTAIIYFLVIDIFIEVHIVI